MKKIHILKKQQEIDNLVKHGSFKKNSTYVIYYKKNSFKFDRFCISVGKKLGNAVSRNKFKRQLRAIIDDYRKNYQNQMDYVVILRIYAKEKSFSQLNDDFLKLMRNIRKEITDEKTK